MILKSFLIIVLILSTQLFAKPLEVPHQVMVLKDWKPYYFVDEDGKPTGYAIELFETVAQNINLEYEYVIVENWKEAWELIENKKIDIIPNVGVTKKRSNLLEFTQFTDLFEVGLFKNKTFEDIHTIDDIKMRSVGVVINNVCQDLITSQITNNKVLFNNYHRALSALENNEIETLCYPKKLVKHSIQEFNLNNIQPFGRPLLVVNRAIGIRTGETHLLHLLDKELLSIKGNGEYQKIYNKWFDEQKDIQIDYEYLIAFILILLVLILLATLYIRSNRLLMTKKELDQKIAEIEKLKDEQLHQQKIILTQSKVAAVGEMLGNIAHQWRQPLSVITTRVSSLQVDVELGTNLSKETITECAEGVLKQANYLSKTIDDFRTFFSADTTKEKSVNLKTVFKQLENLIKPSFEHNYIKCIVDIDESVSIYINENILIQACINICNNAKDVMVEKVKDSDQRYFFVTIYQKSNQVIIEFKDSGGGIEENIIGKVFEPYFTTKHASIGTGIGLYMTHQIITKQLQGTINVHNTQYTYDQKKLQGALFQITLPIQDKSTKDNNV